MITTATGGEYTWAGPEELIKQLTWSCFFPSAAERLAVATATSWSSEAAIEKEKIMTGQAQRLEKSDSMLNGW
jgi:hypothetical protein